ncbi:MAG: LysM peptidoglycan-binding domain-containing protein, partial [Anaerolineae bacterium]
MRIDHLLLVIISASMLVLTACNLALEEEILNEATIDVTEEPTAMVAAETTPEPPEPVDTTAPDSSDSSNEANSATSNVVSVSQANTTSTDNANCTPRTNLATYTVVTGDTLYSIATAHNSTVSELSVYNCLVDTNVLSVGQQLYVPDAGNVGNQ